MCRFPVGTVTVTVMVMMVCAQCARAADAQNRYYAHAAAEDQNGVIAPWYTGQNGQCDLRVRIAAETLKRYPWTDTNKAVAALPEYVFSGAWKITADGTITIPSITDWMDGDLGQRAAYVLSGLVDYYRYTGDAAAIAHITFQADALLDYCLTPPDHPWPEFLISVPVKGKPYGRCDPHGFIQLDIVAEAGVALIRASQLTGNARWFDAAKHWGDLLAKKRSCEPGLPPWPRYANPEDVHWSDRMTGGVVFILDFLDALIDAGYTGEDNAIVEARRAGVAYLADVLLPDWTGGDTWGRNYWDWPCPVQVENVTEFVARYLMEHPDEFPNWRTDARNIMGLFLNRTGVSPKSNGDTYSGAWAYPESAGCCSRSLWYGPMELANVYAQYGVLADSEWGRELARRQILLATYDCHTTGVVEDNIDGGQIVAGAWFKIAHPMALKHTLSAMAWLPDVLGPSRENHIMRSTGVVTSVEYDDGLVSYHTHEAPRKTVDVLRLAFRPAEVIAAGSPPTTLALRHDDKKNGYQVRGLPGGDFIVTIRHDGHQSISVHGDDPQETVKVEALSLDKKWTKTIRGTNDPEYKDRVGDSCQSGEPGATMTCTFSGNQVRLLGCVGPDGGLADVYLDGMKQLVGIDCWNPSRRLRQVLYHKSGLPRGEHVLKVVVRGEGNPVSDGERVELHAVLYSSATGEGGFGEGGGPAGAQRLIFGYTGREDCIDSAGNTWRPATEFVIRAGHMVDSVATSWQEQRTRLHVGGTSDPELYRYGAHGRDFWVNFTVGPGTYHARLKFLETRNVDPKQRAVTVCINDREVATNMDIAATAGRLHHAVDLVFNRIEPVHGIICIRFRNDFGGEAMVQAIEIGPGDGGHGSTPVTVPQPEPERRQDSRPG